MVKASSRTRGKLLFCLLTVCTAQLTAKRAPDPGFKTLDGQSRKLSELRGQAVVANFWATWCEPCQEELPRLSQLASYYSGRPIRFIFISIDNPKDRPKIPVAIARLHISIDSWVGADTDTLGRFGLGDIVPGTIILDDKGEIVSRIMGEAKEEDIRTAADWLLNNKSGQTPPPLIKRY